MKKTTLFAGILASFMCFSSFSQQAVDREQTYSIMSHVPTMTFSTPDMESIRNEDLTRDRNGMMYRIGVGINVNITTENSGAWKIHENGDRVWQLKIDYPGAEALSFLFDKFILSGDSRMDVLGLDGKKLHKTYNRENVLDHGMQNMALCFGDEMVLQLIEPAGTQASIIELNQIMYGYRSTGNPNVQKINESDDCEVNVNCSPEGNDWQQEKRGVARILVTDQGQQGWCTGSLVNNTSQNCKPYFLTALHCGVTASTANFNLWQFYFGYEAPGCSNPGTAGTLDDHFITGCVKISSSLDGGGNSGSDFLLVQLGSLANEATTISTLKSANFNAYWNGWDANNTTSNAGVGIHHPAGDIKKISRYTSNLSSTSWGGTVANTHWALTWVATTNGHGVTEGGSSGSPLFRFNGGNSRIIGTLTGGSSFCTSPNSPDAYGKMSFHWTSNGTPAVEQLKPWLDPGNTGVLVLDGSADPCSAPQVPVANFVGNPTTVAPGGTVTFTDLTSGTPTSWAWTITPGTGWSFTGGTSASSQNPQVIFNTVGTYTVSLTATNAQGSDVETKNNYITVAVSSGPCAATSTEACATGSEYIAGVQLNTINNSTACGNYTNYSGISTNLTKGNVYTVTVNPGIIGQSGITAYTDDEIAVYIDYNGDNDFTDVGERIAYVIVANGWNNIFNFTVPASATTGTTKMRVRISYQPDDGAIVPCGDSQWGEVEDYVINIQGGSSGVGLEETILNELIIFPNPTTGDMTIDLSDLTSRVNIEVYDLTGKLLISEDVNGGMAHTVNLTNYNAGIYQVKIVNNGRRVVRRITKM